MAQPHTPLVSIILPVYNAKDHIARCIESIRAQTFADFELIIVNDGSSDNVSLPICQMYAQVDSRILLVDKENSGVSNTRNVGIGLAAGKYLQFVDSDDYLAPDYTQQLVSSAEENNADMVIAHYYMVIPRGGASNLREKGLAFAEKAELPFAERMRAVDEQPPEVRKNGFLAEGAMDKETFALHLMDKPASFYYGVMWNKLYRRDIILAHDVRCNADISWSEDFLFNLNYIRWANTFYATQAAGYYYVQNPNSLVHSKAMDLPEMWSTKAMLFGYYKDLYEHLGLYEENKLTIAKYLVGMAESTAPTNPLVKTLGESVEAVKDALLGEDEAAPAPVTIAPAAPGDGAAIAALTEAELGCPCAPALAESQLAAALADPAQQVWVARQGDAVVGYAHAAARTLLYQPPQAELLALAVARRSQRQGVATALLDAVCAWAAARGAAQLCLGAGVEQRKAQSFCRDYGFVPEKKRAHFTLTLGVAPQ